MFFDCSYAKFLWCTVQISFSIPAPSNIDDLFTLWLHRGGPTFNSLLLVAAAALCWAIWLTRNEVVFDKINLKSFLRVLFRGTHWLRQWASLQCHDTSTETAFTPGGKPPLVPVPHPGASIRD